MEAGDGDGVSNSLEDDPAPAQALNREEAVRLARLFPFDRKAAQRALLKRARDPVFAQSATYLIRQRVSSGETTSYEWVHRPSVRLARPIADALGHFSFGARLVMRGVQAETLAGWAFDAQKVTYAESAPEEFSTVRKTKDEKGRVEYVPLSEQSARAGRNRLASILIRVALLQIIPEEVTQAVLERCVKTQEEQAVKRVQKDREKTMHETLEELGEYGVNAADVEAFLQHGLGEYTPADEMALQGILRSAQEGLDPRELLDAPRFDEEQKASETVAPIREDGGGATPGATAMSAVSDSAVVLTHRSEPLDPDDDRWEQR